LNKTEGSKVQDHGEINKIKIRTQEWSIPFQFALGKLPAKNNHFGTQYSNSIWKTD
jgi:hypothetical protein